MKNLYGTIKVSKILGLNNVCIEESINYYKLKNKKYGLEIVKSNNTNDKTIEVANIKNITDNEEKIDNLLNDLVIKQIAPNSSDVIEDLVKIHAW